MNTRNQGSKQNRLFERLEKLYAAMEAEYDRVARRIGLDCRGCPDNCCVSYFQHHTYIEWAYLWHGLRQMSRDSRDYYLGKARDYSRQCEAQLRRGRRPEVMCPLNEDGLCVLYPFRLMICRFHGVPNQVTMPDGTSRQFPGCIVCQHRTESLDRVPVLDRTASYIKLAELERTFTAAAAHPLPKVDLTLADMLVQGPPDLMP